MKWFPSAVAVLLFASACASPARQPEPAPGGPAALAPPRPPEPPPAPEASSPTPPDTPAGHVLRAWLDAFNGGDEGAIAACVAKYKLIRSPDSWMAFRRGTGGFELLGIDASEPRRVAFRVKEKASPTIAAGAFFVTDTDPTTVAWMTLLALSPGVTADDILLKVDTATRARVISGVVAQLNDSYVFPEGATKMEAGLRAHQQHGDYDRIDEADWFAWRLTEDLRDVSHDLHLSVQFAPRVLPREEPGSKAPPDPRAREELMRIHCGFEKTERLEPGIGYVKLNMFGDPEVCEAEATTALGALGDVGALVLDLRDNGGGRPAMVAFVASYVFGKRTHLNDIYTRKGDKTTPYWTKPDVPGRKYPDVPVFVLTSKRTFSGAEELAYDLKNLKRATIVGETTVGGAHPTRFERVDDHFGVMVPHSRAVNPITKTNWEGTGVEPDVKVPAEQALDVAKKMAGEAIARRGKKAAAPR
jgi:retinol-binding protein 3